MPQVVPFLVKVGTLVTFGAVEGKVALAIIGGIATIGTFAASRFLKPKINMNIDDNAGTRSATVRSTTEPQKRVYGETLVSGPITYAQVSGTNNRYLHQVIALAGHELTAIDEIRFDEHVLDLTNSSIYNPSTKQIISGKFGPKNNENDVSEAVVYIDTRLGAASQTAYSALRSDNLTSQEYLETHRGDGIASVYVRMTTHEGAAELWDDVGNPRNIRALVRGAKVYDPRLEVDAGGTAGANPTNASYVVYDDNSLGVGNAVNQYARDKQGQNPALIIADLLMNDDFGLGIPASKIDWPSVITAADNCDQLVVIPTSSVQKRFFASGVIFGSDSHRRSIEKILMAMDGDLLYSQGKYYIKAGVYEAPTETFTENDVVSAVQVKTATPRQDRFNQVSGLFIDPNENYKLMEFGPVTVDGAYARDNSEVLPEEIKLPFTSNRYAAQRIAWKKVNQSFAQTMIQVTVNLKGMRVRVGDRINLTLTDFESIDSGNWSPKIFKVISWGFTEDGSGVDLTLIEDASSYYADPDEDDYSTIDAQGTITTALPDVPSPSSFTATSQINSILLEWTNPANNASWEQIWVFRNTTGTTPTDSDTPITRLRSTSFTDQREAEDSEGNALEYYYWIQAVKYPSGTTPSSGNANKQKSPMIALSTPSSGKISASKIGQNVMGDNSVGSDQVIDGNIGSAQIATTIQSNNWHETNQTGWQINKTGDVTFNSGNFRGTVTVGSTDLTSTNTLNSNTTASDVGLGNVDNTNSQNTTQNGLISGTTITGGGITLSSGGVIKGGQTEYNDADAAGFFLGYDSNAYKFSIGNSDNTQRLTFDGGTLSVKGTITVGSTDLTEANTLNSNTNATDVAGLPQATFTSIGASTYSPAVNGSRVTWTETSATENWTHKLVSDQAFSGGAFVTFVINKDNATNSRYMVGLANVATGNSFSVIDYAVYVKGTADEITAYESNVAQGTLKSSITAGDTITVFYDGNKVQYLINGTVEREVNLTAPLTGQIYAHIAIDDGATHDVEHRIDGLQFGAVTSVVENLVDGVQITGGGITMSEGGAIKTVNKDSESDTTDGFFMGYNGSAYTFAIGNGTKSMTWDGTDLTVKGGIIGTTVTVASGTTITDDAGIIENDLIDTDFPLDTTYYWPCNSIAAVGGGEEELQEVISSKTGLHSGTTAPTISTDSPSGRSVVNGSTDSGFTLLSDTDADALETSGFAWSFWFKSETTSGNSQARIITRDASDGWALLIDQSASGNQSLTLYGEPSSESMGSVAQGEWHHFCFSSDGSGTGGTAATISGYLNGELVSTESYEPLNTSRPVVIGCNTESSISSTSDVFNGKFTEIRAYNRALTAKEVRSLYKNPAAGNPARIDGDLIVDGSITADQIKANTITVDEMAADSVTSTQINVTELADISDDAGTITGGSVGGTTITSTALYQGGGNWANSDTGFYLDNTGQFSLKDKLFFNPTNSRLTVDGNITADTITVNDQLVVLGPLEAKSLAAGSITREMLSQDVLDEIFGSLATSVGGSNGDYKEGTGNFTTSGGTVTLGTSSDKFDHGTADVDVEFIIDHFFYATTNYTTTQAQATLNFEVSADGTFTDLTSATKTHTLQFNEYDLSSYYGYTYLVYYLTGDVTKTFTSGSGNDIPDDTDLQFRVRVTGVGTAFTSQTVPFTLEANEGVTGVVSTGGNADTLDNLDSTAFLRSNTDDTFNGVLTVTGNITAQSAINTTGDVTVGGNLVVNGDTVTLNAQTLQVEDNQIVLNYHATNDTSATADNSGILIQDAVDGSTDASLLWEATGDYFHTSHSFQSAGNLISTSSTGYVKAKSLRLENSEVDDADFNSAYQLIVDANDALDIMSNKGDFTGGHPFGIFFLGDNGGTTKTLGSGLVGVWNTTNFKKAHVDYLVSLYDSGVTSTEYDYLDGVTSSIQTQLDGKVSAANATLTGTTNVDELLIENPEGIGHIALGSIQNDAGSEYIRGGILITRDAGQVTYDASTDNWTFAGGASTDWGAMLHRSSELTFFAGEAVSSQTTINNSTFNSTYRHMAISTNGDITMYGSTGQEAFVFDKSEDDFTLNGFVQVDSSHSSPLKVIGTASGNLAYARIVNDASAATTNKVGLEFRLNTTVQERQSTLLQSEFTTTTDASRQSRFRIYTINAGNQVSFDFHGDDLIVPGTIDMNGTTLYLGDGGTNASVEFAATANAYFKVNGNTEMTLTPSAGIFADRVEAGGIAQAGDFLKSESDEPTEVQANAALGGYACFVGSGSTYVAVLEPDTVIYEFDPATGNEKVFAVRSPDDTAGVTTVSSRIYRTKGQPFTMKTNGRHDYLAPLAFSGHLFGIYSNRYTPQQINFYAPSGGARVNVYMDSGTNGTIDYTFDILPNQFKTYTAPSSGGYFVFEVIGAPLVATLTGSGGGDHDVLRPASRFRYYGDNTFGLQTTKEIYTHSNATIAASNTVTYSYTSPVYGNKIGDGAGGDTITGVPLQMLADNYLIGHSMDGITFTAPYPDTEIKVYEHNGTSWALVDSYSLDGSLTSPANTTDGSDLDGGGTGYTASGRSVLVCGNKPFLVSTNDPADDEYEAEGWLSKYHNALPKQSSVFAGYDGTVSLPNFTFADDTDTGIYRSAANQVSFAANGVEQFLYGTARTRFNTQVQVGTGSQYNSYGRLQVNQSANNDESGIGVLSASGARSMRLWTDETNSYINSGDAGSGFLYLNEDVRVTNAGNFERIGSHLSGFQIGGYDNIGNNRDKINPIYVIGDSYLPTSDTDATNMFGITFSRSGASGPSVFDWTANSGWGFGVITSGTGRIWLDGDEGVVEATGGYNINGTVFCDADRDISVRDIQASGTVSLGAGTVGTAPNILSIKTTTEANTAQGDVYAGLIFQVSGAENSTGAISDNTVAAIKAIDYRSGTTSFEDSGIGFYTLDSDESAHTFRGGFSNQGGFFVSVDGNVDRNTGEGDIYADSNIEAGNHLAFNNSFKLGSTVLIDSAATVYINTISVVDGDFVVSDGNNTGETNIIWRDHSADRLYLGTTTDIVEFRGDVNFQSGHILQHNGVTVLNSSRQITNVPLVNIVGGVPELRLSDDSNSYGGGSQHKIIFATTGGNVGFMGIDSTSYSTIVIANNAGHGDVTSAMSSYDADIELYPQNDVNIKSGNLEMSGTTVIGSDRTVYAQGTASNDTPRFTFDGDTNTGIGYIASDAVGLIAGGSRKFYTTTTNAYFQNLTGGVHMKRLTLGTNPEDAGELFINDTSTTSYTLGLLGTGTRGYQFRGSASSADYNLTFDNQGTGFFNLFINGELTVGEDDTGHDVRFYGDTSSRYVVWDASADLMIFRDNTKATFGNASDLQIYHTGSHSYIDDTGTGNLYIRHGTDNAIFSRTDGEVILYHNGTSKAATKSSGFEVYGNIDASDYIEANEASGGVALTVNDGGGNANLTFNHNHEFTRVAGSWTRIKTDVDGTTAAFEVYLHDNVAANTEYSYNTNGAVIDAKLSRIQFMNNEAEISSTGNAIFEGNVTAYGTASDIRLKSDIEVIPEALSKVQKLRGVRFTYDKDGSRSTGLIAQEVMEVLPEVVYETHEINEDEPFYALRYGNTVGLLVEAIKEQQGIIEALTKRIEDLENGNDAD